MEYHLQNGQELLEFLSELKPMIVKQYDDWVAKHGQPDDSIPSFLSIAKEETAIRKANEQRARLAYEASLRDPNLRRDEQRRPDDRRAREGSPWSEPEEARRRELPVAPDAGRAERSRDVDEDQYNAQAERLRREEDARIQEAERVRRRTEERRQYEQEIGRAHV